MKFEFTAAIKAVPMADVHVSIDCSAEELAIALADPVYQKLGEKLISEVSFKPQCNDINQARPNRNREAQGNRNAQTHDRHEQQAQRAQEMRRQQDEAVMKMLQQIANQLDRLARH